MLFKIPSQIRELKEYLDQLQGKWSVHIRPPNRSLDQNALFHATIDEMAKASGYTPQELKAILKQSITNSGILQMVETKETAKGMPYQLQRSSKDLTSDEMTLLINYTLQMQEAQQRQLKEYANDLFSN